MDHTPVWAPPGPLWGRGNQIQMNPEGNTREGDLKGIEASGSRELGWRRGQGGPAPSTAGRRPWCPMAVGPAVHATGTPPSSITLWVPKLLHRQQTAGRPHREETDGSGEALHTD